MRTELVLAGIPTDPAEALRELTAYPFMVHALEAATVVAVLAAVVGWFMVLRRETFAGHTLSVMAFPGGSGALLIGLPTAVGYFAVCGAAAVVIGVFAGGGRRSIGSASSVVGSVQAFGLACGFVFVSLYHGVLGGLESLLFGDFLGVSSGQVAALAGLAVVVLAFFAAVGRPLLFASVDGGVAATRGVPVRALGIASLVGLGLCVGAVAQITGALLVFALLVAPAASAQHLTARIGLGLAVSVALALVIAWSGLALAYFYGQPVGFYVTSVALVVYVIARLVGR